jgi:replicative DNA helicase
MQSVGVLPHNIEAEEYVIGSILIDQDCMDTVPDILKPEHFYRDRNRWIYEAMLEVWKQGRPPDVAVVSEELHRKKLLQEVGGLGGLSTMCAVVPTSVHAMYYAEMIANAAVNRGVIAYAKRLSDTAFDNPYDVENTIASAESGLIELYPERSRIGMMPMKDIMDDFLATQGDSIDGIKAKKIISSGFMDIDIMLGGLPRGDMIIVAARPGVGKSALALNIARRASENNAITGIFSLEMGREQVALRMISEQSGINGMRVRQGIYTEAEESLLMDAVGHLSDLPLYVDDAPRIDLSQLRSKAKRLQASVGLDLLIVDYIQLVTLGGNKRYNRVEEVTEITAALKGLARDLDIPLIALSQLNRASEGRTDHRPQLSDLRDSGSIEQDADTVLFLFREEMHYQEDDWITRYPNTPYPRGMAEVIVAKHRHGAMGTIKLFFNAPTVAFKDLAFGAIP